MSKKQLKLLIVDSDTSALEHFARTVRKMGFSRITLAESGDEALKLIRIGTPDIILLNSKLPDMDGTEAMMHLRRMPALALTPIVLILNESDARSPERLCSKFKANSCLQKPFHSDRLNYVLQTCIEQTGRNRRKHLRTGYTKKVEVDISGEIFVLKASMLSEGGIFLLTDSPYDINTRIILNVPVEGGTLTLRGKVIYHMGFDENTKLMKKGMAIKFQRLTDESAEALTVFVKKLIESSGT